MAFVAAAPLVVQAIPEVGKTVRTGIEQAPGIITSIGTQAKETQFIPQTATFVENAASGTVGLAKGVVSSAAHTTFSIAEKMMLAMIILIVLILLVVGVSLLVSANYKTGFVFTLFGVMGAAGAAYWARNPATPGVLGEGEPTIGGEDEVIDEETDDDIDFQELEGDIDYLEVEPEEEEKKNHVHFEDADADMHKDLSLLVSIIEGKESPQKLVDLREYTESQGIKLENFAKKSVEIIDKILAKKGELSEAYKKLSEEDKNEIKSLLEEFKKLCLEANSQNREIEGKIMELSELLSSS